jgi:hypothetical protein
MRRILKALGHDVASMQAKHGRPLRRKASR